MVFVGMILCSLFLVAVWRVNFDEKTVEREPETVSVADSASLKAHN